MTRFAVLLIVVEKSTFSHRTLLENKLYQTTHKRRHCVIIESNKEGREKVKIINQHHDHEVAI